MLSACRCSTLLIFHAACQCGKDALLNTVIIGSVNVFSTIVAIVLVDRWDFHTLLRPCWLLMKTCSVCSELNILTSDSPSHQGFLVRTLIVCCRLGRRFLFFQGGAQVIASLAIAGALIKYNTDSLDNDHMAQSIVAFICIYVAGFAWSWGPLAWLVPSEIATMETRSAGMSIATCSNFLWV
jgi:hypothetical protein